MNDIHKRGGTILGTSRGGHDTSKIVDSIQDRGINQVRYSFFFSDLPALMHALYSRIFVLHAFDACMVITCLL